MTIQIDVSNAQKVLFLVELLKSFDFVDVVKVKESDLANNGTVPKTKLSELLLAGPTMTASDKKYYEQKQKHFKEWK
jgi:hypothetical protein